MQCPTFIAMFSALIWNFLFSKTLLTEINQVSLSGLLSFSRYQCVLKFFFSQYISLVILSSNGWHVGGNMGRWK